MVRAAADAFGAEWVGAWYGEEKESSSRVASPGVGLDGGMGQGSCLFASARDRVRSLMRASLGTGALAVLARTYSVRTL
jgi:hypothetical protein